MALTIRDPAGVQRAIGAGYIRDASAALKAIDKIRIRDDAGTLREVYQAGIRLSVDPSSASGFSSSKTGPVTSNSVTVGVAGGTPPYTHSWSATFGITANTPTSATTSFTATPPGLSGTVEGSATDTVTDANGLTNSIGVDIYIERQS